MAFCIGYKGCKRAQCKQRCKGWFGAQPDIERACKNACGSDYNLPKDGFLCSGNWIEDAIVISAYGYDPCLNSGASFEDIYDPLGDRQREDEELKRFQPVILGGAFLVLAAMAFLFFIIKR